MTICVGLIAGAWFGVRLVSPTAAIVMSAVALAIPPFAAIIANAGREGAEGRPECLSRATAPPRPDREGH
jgi:hypothetical protein